MLLKKNLSFFHVDANDLITFPTLFDGALATFVHPTISSKNVLLFQFKKIYSSLKNGSKLALLGLHTNSFEYRRFLYYKHKAPVFLTSGMPFENTLKLPNKDTLTFTDFYWSASTLTQILKLAGFTEIHLHDILESNLVDSTKDICNVISKQISKNWNVNWDEEWVAPLYQIIIAKK